MSYFSRLWSRAPSEMDKLREELRLTRLQQEADRTAFRIQEQQFKRVAARFLAPPAPPISSDDPIAKELALRENWPGWFTGTSFGAVINPLTGFYDGVTPLMATVPTLWDYTLNLGFYVTEAWLDILRMYARVWYSVTPQAQGVMRGLRDYIIHTGFDYQVQPKPGKRVGAKLPENVQRVVDDFLTRNQWFETESDWFLRLHRDGEVFPYLFPQDDGVTQVRTVEPWQVRGENTTPENMFGPISEKGDRETIVAYRVTMSGSGADAELVSPERMCQIKINTDKQVKRGVSDFVATQQLFRDLTTLLQNTQVGEALRQALVWVQETTGAAIPLDEFGPTGAPLSPPPGFAFSGPGSWGPGQIPTMDKNLQFKPGPVGDTTNATNALQLAYQALSVYYRVPEWMVSGTSAANFAASLTQESPLVRMAQGEQKFLKDKFSAVIMMALRIAELQEILEPGTCDRITLNVEATPLVVREAGSETARNKTLHDDGILSKKTWSVREELDRDAELENIEEERVYDAAHPPPAPPQQPGDPNAPPGPNAPPPTTPSTTPTATYAREAPRPEDGNAAADNPFAGLSESVHLRERASTPPFPGGVFNESTHRWEKGSSEPPASKKNSTKTAGESGPGPAVTKEPRIQPDTPPERFAKSVTGRNLIDANVQRWAEGTNEPEVAKHVGGKALPDNEPMDVILPPPPEAAQHGLELKTMVSNSTRTIHMKGEAQARKRAWRRKNKLPVHTVVIDDTLVYNANGPGHHDLSKRRIFYRRGFGSFKVDGMHEVEGGMAGLKALIDTPTRALPPGAWKPKPKEKAEAVRESVALREHASVSPFPGGVFNEGTHHWEKPGDAKAEAPKANTQEGPSPETHATAKALVERSNLTPELKEQYAAHMATALHQLPEGARMTALKSIAQGGANFHESLSKLRANYLTDGGPKSGAAGLLGYVKQKKGTDQTVLNLDGADPAATDPQYTATGVYLHELGHAADPDGVHSSDPKWQSAWKREIFSPPAGKPGLTKYARIDASEGFAEMIRVVAQKGVETVRKTQPKCVAFLESKGLI